MDNVYVEEFIIQEPARNFLKEELCHVGAILGVLTRRLLSLQGEDEDVPHKHIFFVGMATVLVGSLASNYSVCQ